MSWNGSGGAGAGADSRAGKGAGHPSASRFSYKALAAGLTVVAIGCIALWWLAGRSGTGPADDGKGLCRPAKITEAMPQIADATAEGENGASAAGKGKAAAGAEEEPASNRTVITSYRDQRRPFRIVNAHKGKKQLFHTIGDIYISRIVNSKIGEPLAAGVNYNNFNEKFKKALQTPITIDPDDTPEEVEKKQAVIEAREELKKRMEAGEDIEKIMRESEAELRKMSLFKQRLKQELAKAMRERKYGADDFQDFVDAANKMLTDNGLEPLKHPQLWVNKIRREEEAAAREQ